MGSGKSNSITSRMSSAKSSLAQLINNVVKSIRAVLCGGVEKPNDKKSSGSIKESMEASLETNGEKPKCPMLRIDRKESTAAKSNTESRNSKRDTAKIGMLGPGHAKSFEDRLNPKFKRSRGDVNNSCLESPMVNNKGSERAEDRTGEMDSREAKSKTGTKLPTTILPKVGDRNPMFVGLWKNREGSSLKWSEINISNPKRPRPVGNDAKSRHALLCDENAESNSAMSKVSSESPKRTALMTDRALPQQLDALTNIKKSTS